MRIEPFKWRDVAAECGSHDMIRYYWFEAKREWQWIAGPERTFCGKFSQFS